MRLLQRMRREELPPSNFSVQQLFAAARGEVGDPDELLQMLMNEMNLGIRPSRPTLDALFDAAPIAVAGGRLPLFLQILDACQHRPSGRTALGLMRQVHSNEDVSAITRIMGELHASTRDALLRHGHLHAARARVDAHGTAAELLAGVRLGGPPPSASVWRSVLIPCATIKDYVTCLSLLQTMWRRGFAMDERTARRMLHLTGEGAAARDPGAVALLEALRTAMFGEDGLSATAQRGSTRRSMKAEHEAVRILARAEWRAGLGDARCVQRMALERLRHAAVPPQRKLLETCVYLHAKQGDFPASLALLNDPFCAREQMRSEGPYLALISAISQPDDVDYAVAALRSMVAGGVIPSLRTRIAFARMAARVRQAKVAQVTTARRRAAHVPCTAPLPSASSFWNPSAQELPLEPFVNALESEDAAACQDPGATSTTDIHHHGPSEDEPPQHARRHAHLTVAAELVLEIQIGALLERIESLMRASPAVGVADASARRPCSDTGPSYSVSEAPE